MGKRRILSVEDNPALAKLVRVFLEAHGYQVLHAGDGESAIRLAEEARPSLILMDIQLPLLSGLDAARAIKSNRKLDGVPVVAMTGFAMEEERRRCYEAGCDGYLTKPFDLDHLLRVIRAHLGPG